MKWKDIRIIVYLKEDERLNEYIKIRNNYFIQSQEVGLDKQEKINIKIFKRI